MIILDDNYLDDSTTIYNDWNDELSRGKHEEPTAWRRSRNLYPYEFGNVEDANRYKKFLQSSVSDKTYHLSSLNRYGDFRTHICVPLTKVDELIDFFLTRGWIGYSQHSQNERDLYIKTQLLILKCLNILGRHITVCALNISINIITSEHRKFFHVFIDKMYSIQDEYVYYARTIE